MKFLKFFIARIAKYLTEVSAMSDEPIPTDSALTELTVNELTASLVAAPLVEPAFVVVLVPETIFAKLETILGALGHELPVFFYEAVALAKKAL
ncbi:hypothetical protein QN366_04900 [Pseudomonas sp. CCC3.2]|uniref:hypothetical protein n=1 Tax=unclassified Pseudomonas TaxID=196821 RepID=UPI002AB5014B|nr:MULTISPECIES: hypothetical protein [unclassified Pseudomonas]MDY7559948.1 hypothetical protein [Pseudomonas sp. AB6]MEA9994552.1 hypothetical protein [Pseudomonas sp. AA4]MEB0085697.1 hypothetical protein [Pseudomonas sp. RTI1]MEB0125978.1 hypothetical protein [Pseudomonas sp. CCC1.2]MEB0152782.1 hypothetical protein [Pseudomonas sp. CCC4.3]